MFWLYLEYLSEPELEMLRSRSVLRRVDLCFIPLRACLWPEDEWSSRNLDLWSKKILSSSLIDSAISQL